MTNPKVRPVIGLMRALLIVGTLFLLVAGVQLYVLTGRTVQYFAWTIGNPLTAATIGGFYLGAFLIAVASASKRRWEMARVGVLPILVFVWLTLGATLAHLGTLHLDAHSTAPRVAAIAWLVVYIADPLLLLLAYVLQWRAPGGSGPRSAPASIWFVIVAAVLGLALTAVGVALFVRPAQIGRHLPWTVVTTGVSKIGAQTLAAWIVFVGLLLGSAAIERDWLRVRPASIGLIGLGAFPLIAVARYPHLHGSAGAGLIALSAVLILLGWWGLVGALRARG